jgi:hypothetical protein
MGFGRAENSSTSTFSYFNSLPLLSNYLFRNLDFSQVFSVPCVYLNLTWSLEAIISIRSIIRVNEHKKSGVRSAAKSY